MGSSSPQCWRSHSQSLPLRIGKLFRVEMFWEGSQTLEVSGLLYCRWGQLQSHSWFCLFFFSGKPLNDPEMSHARPRYVIERPAYSVSLFDEEFEKKSRSYPVGEKLKNLFR